MAPSRDRQFAPCPRFHATLSPDGCRGRLGPLRSKPPGTAVVPDPALETFLPGIKDTTMRMSLDVTEVGKWHPVDGTMAPFAKGWCLALLCSTSILSSHASRFGSAWFVGMMFTPPLTLSALQQRCVWAPLCDRLPWEDRLLQCPCMQRGDGGR